MKEEKKAEAEKKDTGVDRIQQYQGVMIQRRALIDQMLLENSKADFSYAERKYRWYSSAEGLRNKGFYSGIDLAEWYRVYNQT